MARETGVQSQVESYQRLKKWYLIPPCLTLSIIRYVSMVKWSNPEKGVASALTPRCSSYRKGSFRVALDYGHQLYLQYIYIYSKYIYIYVCVCVCVFWFDIYIRGSVNRCGELCLKIWQKETLFTVAFFL